MTDFDQNSEKKKKKKRREISRFKIKIALNRALI